MKKILFLFLVLLCISLPCCAENFYIKNYDIEIHVAKDNSYHIKEGIVVNFVYPSHGIYRKIPIKNTVIRANGTKYTNSAKILNVKTSDLVSSSYADNAIIYKMGDSNKQVYGDMFYSIEYDYILSSNSVAQNEFYFNLIGPEWETYINKVSFSIFMPKEFDPSGLDFASGYYGSLRNGNEVLYKTNGYQIKGYTLKPLKPREALTIRIPLPENYFIKRIIKYKNESVAVAILAAIISFVCWFLYGRDEKIIPVVSFKPPKGLNCAQLAVLYKNYVDSDCTVSLILYLASKGYIRIDDYDGMTSITKLKEYDGKNLATKCFFDELFQEASDDTVPLYKLSTSDRFRDALLEYEKTLDNLRQKIYDKNSTSFSNYFLPLLCVVFSIAVLLFASNDYSFGFISRCGFLLLFPIFALFGIWLMFSSGRSTVGSKVFILVWASFFGGIPLVGMIFEFGIFSTISDTPALIALVCTLISIICTINMPRKNQAGRKILGEILGFKKFIETTEKNKLEMLALQNPNYIHQILPYAFALGVDGIWLDKLSGLVGFSSPDWYNGEYNSHSFVSFRRFVSDVITSSRTHSSYKYRSSSSSGSFSGGGSGGGGGGSW